ncbi:MAG: hypothetical protein ABS95_01935 [Verrucomicrobia bacterium SCN 57-15]|nr:MAG: hypothetical protein ABS95_01935 [Verrucomicrobia bacterium SCN 57-15]
MLKITFIHQAVMNQRESRRISGECLKARPLPARPIMRLALFGSFIACTVILYLLLLSLLRGFQLSSVAAFVLAAGCLGWNVVFLRTEKLTLAALGIFPFQDAFRKFGAGLAWGMAVIAGWLIIIVVLLSPGIKLHSALEPRAIVNLVLFYLFNSGAEEFAYRGYAFLLIRKSYGRWTALAGTSVVFTLLHVQGGMAWVNALAGVFTSALILAVLFDRWQSLPLALGFHFAMNIAQDLLGVRQTPLSLLTLNYDGDPGPLGTATLLSVALFNLAIFALLAFGFRRRSFSN